MFREKYIIEENGSEEKRLFKRVLISSVTQIVHWPILSLKDIIQLLLRLTLVLKNDL